MDPTPKDPASLAANPIFGNSGKSLIVLVRRVACWSEWLLCGTCNVDLTMNVDQQWREEGQILLSILAHRCHKTSCFCFPTRPHHKQPWGLLTRSIWRGLPPDPLQQPVRQVGESVDPTPSRSSQLSSEPNLWQLRENFSYSGREGGMLIWVMVFVQNRVPSKQLHYWGSGPLMGYPLEKLWGRCF